MKRPSSDKTSSASSTLDEYEVREVSVRRAAKILRRLKHHHLKEHPATDADSENQQAAGNSSEGGRFPKHQDDGYEIEEIELENLAIWMSDGVSSK